VRSFDPEVRRVIWQRLEERAQPVG